MHYGHNASIARLILLLASTSPAASGRSYPLGVLCIISIMHYGHNASIARLIVLLASTSPAGVTRPAASSYKGYALRYVLPAMREVRTTRERRRAAPGDRAVAAHPAPPPTNPPPPPSPPPPRPERDWPHSCLASRRSLPSGARVELQVPERLRHRNRPLQRPLPGAGPPVARHRRAPAEPARGGQARDAPARAT